MTRPTARLGLLALVLGLCVVPLSGQTPVQAPTWVEFTPSPDHDAVYADGTKIVSGYYLRAYRVTAPSVIVNTMNLGKPPIGTNGRIRASITIWVAGLPKDHIYVARVITLSAAGAIDSPVSNPFEPPPMPTGATNVVIGK